MERGVNYVEAFIAVADDCPVTAGTIPPERGGKPTVAGIQYELLHGRPYELTSEDVIFESSTARRQLEPDTHPEVVAARRSEFFSRPQACLRASPLPKRFGWGFHFDSRGRVALLAMESVEYDRFSKDPTLRQLEAMRSRRG